ncbi:MAG TPA: TaqI-like C-terminal specificity domain-containing protein [Thermoanaerobaculia bacterium]|nr:TaqI-like C-terminal specificity domain-containing protein [Thermoanaerobaculia bacterium]HQP87061.1 TaqI-like C-terminal specificity domain-containing protein [Thermoanaerobaculia bacterium]
MLEQERQRSASIGASYLGALSIEERREAGMVYTPDVLVAFVFDQAGFTEGMPIERYSLLDPACGAGAFIVEAVARLARRFTELGYSFQRASTKRTFIDLVERNVHGIDLDSKACVLARETLRRGVEEIVGGSIPVDRLAGNITEADFLLGGPLGRFDREANSRQDFIVGNPPYVSATRIPESYKRALRARFSTAVGRFDLYTLFMERAIDLLRDGGRLAFITPDKFLSSRSAGPFRALVRERAGVLSIARFGSHKVFADAATVPCVTVIQKGEPQKTVEVRQCRLAKGVIDRIEVVRRSSLPATELQADTWDVVDPDLLAIARKIQDSHRSLSVQMLRMSAGPATGRDSVFIVQAGEEVEPELLRPIVRGRDIAPFRLADTSLRMLVPYEFPKTGPPQRIDLKKYPKARRYLEAHKRELEQRHCVRVWGKPWFDWHDQPPLDLSRELKIVVPDVAKSSRFAVDDGRRLPVHSVYYLIPRPGIDSYAIAAILNSKVAEFVVRLLSPVMKDGFSRYRQQFLRAIPVPDLSTETATELARAAREGDATLANDLVAKLFRLLGGELEKIERFLRSQAIDEVPGTRG